MSDEPARVSPNAATATPINRATAEHYVWGGVCDGWHLVQGQGLSVIEERMPAGTAERRHMHRHARQFFHVLAGVLTLELAGQTHRICAAAGIEVAPGVPHKASNASAGDVVFLVISAPTTRGDRVDLD